MNNSSYIVVMAWMMTRLGLNGNELLAYALIYSYSQDAQGCYFGSLSHTAERLNISRRAAVDVLNRLLDKGHITKSSVEVDGVARCMYKAVVPSEVEGGPPPKEKHPARKTSPTKVQRPTLDEVKAYCAERGNIVDVQRFFDFYEANGWCQGRGKPIRDWRAAVRTWERGNNTYTTLTNGQRVDKESVLARRREEITREVATLDAEYCARRAGEMEAGRVPGKT